MASELELLRHAKNYLDKLANGVDPLTDEMLPDTDIVNEVRISRCLFFVSDILRQVIDKGGLNKEPKARKVPFELTVSQIHEFQLFERPIHVSAIAERLNSLIAHERMKNLKAKSITTFLEQQALLTYSIDSRGKIARRPTEQGMALGISTELRQGQMGFYTVVLYDQSAQQYILDHMSQIAAINQLSSKQLNANPRLTESVNLETGEIVQQGHDDPSVQEMIQ